MLISDLAKDRAYCQQHISTYRGRRRLYAKKYGVGSERYKRLSHGISISISNLKKRMARIDVKNKEIRKLERAIIEYVGVSPRTSPYTKPGKNARKLYYKWGLEHKINGAYLRKYIGQKGTHQPSRTRLNFTRSFKDIPENKQLWEGFKMYMTSNQLG